ALYAYRRRGDDVRAAYYPFCAYSPEYVALRVGREVGAEVGFCDLPASVTLEWEDAPDRVVPPETAEPAPPLPLAGEGAGGWWAAPPTPRRSSRRTRLGPRWRSNCRQPVCQWMRPAPRQATRQSRSR